MESRRLIAQDEFLAQLWKQGFIVGRATEEDKIAAQALLAWVNNPPPRATPIAGE